MKRIWLSLIAAGLLTIAAFAPVAGEETITLDLEETDDSGVSGSVRLAASNGGTDIEVLITMGLEDGAVHPTHIHDGSCDDLGGVAYPLDDIVGGVSETTVEVDLQDLLEGEYAINVHQSADEMQMNIACADLPGVGGPGVDDEDDAVADDEAAVDDEDDAVEDDAAVDDAVSDDDAVADDDEVTDDQEHEADDEVVEEDDHADDVEDEVVPAAGSVGGPSSDTIALLLALMAGSALGVGVLVRRQASSRPPIGS